MVWLVVLIVVVVAVVFVLLKQRAAQGDSSADGGDVLDYERAVLFSPAERSFLGVLDQALGAEYRILGKVRLADVFAVGSNVAKAKRRSAFNRISAKHFDFLVCSTTDLEILCAVELNDSTHARATRQKRDTFVEEVCRRAGLPLVTFPAQHGYAVADVRTRILSAFGAFESAVPEAVPAAANVAPTPSSEVTTLQVEAGSPAEVLPTATETIPSCPRCSSPMVKQTGKSGEFAGREFWGCSRFPTCRAMKPC